jgi:divinyl protochlorophyllide a 8-vinyl-reductase
VAAHRIPGPFRRLLRALPARLAVPLLLKAFARHAWTFAGRGRFTVEGAYPGTIRLEDCPTCREPIRGARGGAYYEAAFAGLLRIAAPDVSVREIACLTQGAPACRFRIHLRATAPTPGDSSCASS